MASEPICAVVNVGRCAHAGDRLVNAGMTPDGATAVVDDMARGIPWNAILEDNGQLIGTAGAGADGVNRGLPHGRHWG